MAKLKTGRHTSALKEARKSEHRRKGNKKFKAKVKEAIKKFTVSRSQEDWRRTQALLDKSVKKKIFHKNKISRMKSHLASLLNAGLTNTQPS